MGLFGPGFLTLFGVASPVTLSVTCLGDKLASLPKWRAEIPLVEKPEKSQASYTRRQTFCEYYWNRLHYCTKKMGIFCDLRNDRRNRGKQGKITHILFK